MATNIDQSQGFHLPSINYDLTNPVDIVGSVKKGLGLGKSLLDLPNEGRARQIQGEQQKKIMDGSLEFMGAKVNPDGISGEYKDRAIAEADRQYAILKGQDVLSKIDNRAATTAATVGYKSGMLDINQAKATEYALSQQHGRNTRGWNPNNVYTADQLPGGLAPQENTQQPTNLSDFVKGIEGFSGRAYPDNRQTSIGYGTKARPGETSITQEEADRRLNEELAYAASEVDSAAKRYGYNLTPNQRMALTSAIYNLGPGVLPELTKNGKRTLDQIADVLPQYNKSNGVFSQGLLNRRNKEVALFRSGGGQQPTQQQAPQQPQQQSQTQSPNKFYKTDSGFFELEEVN